MRPVQAPPILKKQWNLNDLWTELLNIGKDDAFREQEDSSYPYWEKWKYLADSWNYDPLKIWTLVKSYRRNKRWVNFSASIFPLDIVSNQTARNDLNQLVARGILETRKSGNKIQFLLTKDGLKKIK